MKKRITATLLALALLLGAVPASVFAAPGEEMVAANTVVASGECGAEGDNVTWTLYKSGLLEISGTGAMEDYGHRDSPWYDFNAQVKRAVIGEGVTTIGTVAFYECYKMTSVTIPDGVTTIGYDAFWDCLSLTDVTIPDSVTTIGPYAFRHCESLTSVIIPAGVTTIGNDAFLECESLTGIFVDEANPNYSSDACGVLFNKGQTLLIQAPGAISGPYSIPDSVTTIGEGAFEDCLSLTDVTIPDSVAAIGGAAFSNCDGLTSVMIPHRVTAIEFATFYDCDGLTSVTIPEGVTTIGENAFAWCGSLADVHYVGTEEQWGQIGISSGNNELTGATIHYESTGPEPVIQPGDMDGSGDLDADDAIYLLYHTLFGDLYPVEGDCDFDGNGVVDADDAIYLLYHTLFGDGLYPLN